MSIINPRIKLGEKERKIDRATERERDRRWMRSSCCHRAAARARARAEREGKMGLKHEIGVLGIYGR